MLEPNNTSLSNHLCLLADSTGQLSIAEVVDMPLTNFKEMSRWQSFAPQKVYWGRVEIENTDIHRSVWYLNTGKGERVDVFTFAPSTAKLVHQQTGAFLPLNQKAIPLPKTQLVQVELPKGARKVIYFRWDNRSYLTHHDFNITLLSPESFYQKENRQDSIQSVFQGIILIMILYNLALFFTTKDIIYLYYSSYIFAGDLYYLYYYGYIQSFCYPQYPEINNFIYILGPNLASIFYIQFLRCFSNTHYLLARLDKVLIYLIGIKTLLIIVLLAILGIQSDLALIRTIMKGAYMLEESFYIIVMIILYRTGDKLSRYFIVGTFCLAAGILFGLLSNSVFGIDMFYYAILNEIGVVAQIFCFSLGLGYRIRLNEKKRLKVQRELIAQLQLSKEVQNRQNEALEEKVAERVYEVEQQKEQIEHQHAELELQNRQLIHLNEEKNNLVRIVAHDLKSPLARIHGLVNVIRLNTDNLYDSQLEYISLIENSVKYLQQMVIRILNVDTATNPENLELVQLDLIDLVEELVGVFKEQASNKKIELHFHHNLDQLPLLTDQNYLESILDNLISNAIKFSPTNRKVDLSITDLSDKKVMISIKDEGPGFSNEDKQKLFRKYQRLSAQPTGGESSTGLGLSIVKKYVYLLGGTIQVESKQNEGACFKVTIPKSISTQHE
ncbi:MAG: 7TM diverse intracellular signaling domain-containing protein [Flammeovirgaceae bacterium]